jgi:hypothetical protein
MRRSALFVFTVVFVGALTLYVGTAAPSLTWAHAGADGGDLISASVVNGVPHPPGYPTYVTLGQAIVRVPIGDVAYRFNLFSAACMALAAAVTALSILQQITSSSSRPRFLREGAAIVASLFFVTAPMVWGQATIAEVHALNACLVALVVYLIAPIVFRGEFVSAGRLVLAAWLWGVAFGGSLTVAALAPVMIVAWWRSTRVAYTFRQRLLPIIAFVAGLGLYALIPLRAAQQPPVNWGDARSLDRFLALITAEMYRGYALSAPPAELLARLIAFAQLIVTQFGWLGVILGAVGGYHALVSPNQNWRWLAVTIVLYVIFAVTYAAADSALYLIPVWMFGAWAIARGLVALTRHLSLVILLVAFLAGPALNVLINFPDMNLRSDRAAVDFAHGVLTAAPPNAIIVTANDGQTFALWYHRHVDGQRPDVAIVDRRMAGYPWYAAMLRAQRSAPRLPEYDPPEEWIDRLAELNAGRVLCVVDQTSAHMACRP